MKWSEISLNPESPEVISWRRQRIKETHGFSFGTYREFVLNFVSGKRAVDLGPSNHDAATTNIGETRVDGHGTTHSWVAQNCDHVTALDIVEYRSHRFENVSYHTVDVLSDSANSVLDDFGYDVIFAGAIMEHISDQGAIFELSSRKLSNDGRLVLTAPNPLWFVGLWDMYYDENFSLNVDHIALPGASSLEELAIRSGLRMVSWHYIGRDDMFPSWRQQKSLSGAVWTIIYFFSRKLRTPISHNLIGAIFVREDSESQ